MFSSLSLSIIDLLFITLRNETLLLFQFEYLRAYNNIAQIPGPIVAPQVIYY